jgi:hypothetical protein
MEFDYQSVALTRIRITDATYCITDQKPSDELVRSIDDLGLIHPPILLPSKDKFVIISGFNRIAACRLLDRTHVTSGVVHPDTPPAKCAIIAVADTTVRRNLNLVEQARAIGLLSRFYDRKETLDAAARRVGLKWSEHLAAKLKKVTRMTPLLQSGLTCGTIALPVALAIHDMTDHEGANAISRILHAADYSLSQQREVFDAIVAISSREAISVEELLHQGDIGALLDDDALEHRQKKQLLRQYLKNRRYPTIASVQKQYEKIRKQLKLKKNMQLIPPSNFESPAFALRLEFENPSELDALRNELDRLVSTADIHRLWDLYKLT